MRVFVQLLNIYIYSCVYMESLIWQMVLTYWHIDYRWKFFLKKIG